MKWTTEQRKVADLIPHETNPRTLSEKQAQELEASIRRFDLVEIPAINTTGKILAGHQRLKMMKNLGRGEELIDVRVPDRELTGDEEKEYLIRSNKNGGDWDFEMLSTDFDADLLGEWGFDDEELNFIMVEDFEGLTDEDAVPTDEDAVPPVSENTTSKNGDVWRLGDHRLMCGDSTRKDNIEILVDGKDVDLWLTDPPYNVNYEGGSGLKIKNDDMPDDEFRYFLVAAYTAAVSVMRAGAVFYIWHSDSEGYNFRGACRDVGLTVRQCIIWNKSSLVLGRQDFQWKHEPCLYGWKDGAGHSWYGARNKTTVQELSDPAITLVDGVLIFTSGEQVFRVTGDNVEVEAMKGTVVFEKKPFRSSLHPTMKPVELYARQIEYSSKRGDLVLDSFGGSGTTIIACEKLRRKAAVMEFDPKYCDVIIKRWQLFTGQKAILVDNDKTFEEVSGCQNLNIKD